MAQNYWLFKSEPTCWSWKQQLKKAPVAEEWSGVRNYEARNNMQKMQLGEFGFFYHSNLERAIVGIVQVCALAHQDSTSFDARWQCVDVRAVKPLAKKVSLREIKEHPLLQTMALLKRSRLSVAPVELEHWQIICELSGTTWLP